MNQLSDLKSRKDTILLLLLGLFSFGGATGRFLLGFALFDIILVTLVCYSLIRIKGTIGLVDFKIIIILSLLIALGIISSQFGRSPDGYSYFITEVRFYLYLPMIYFISMTFRFSLDYLEKILPVILVVYMLIWGLLLTPGSLLFRFFNTGFVSSIGDHLRINGPHVLILQPILLLLLYKKPVKSMIIILYSILIFLIFIKTGGRTYFIYYSIPLVFLMFKWRKNYKLVVLPIILLITSIILVKELTSQVFFERLLKVFSVTEDTSFMYRFYNITAMIKHFSGKILLIGYGIGSAYNFELFDMHTNFFLDNTFVTLIYKVGIIGLSAFLWIFVYEKSIIPIQVYLFELAGLILVGSLSYHLILNPVFLFGYFLVFNYFKNTHNLKKVLE